MNTTTLQVPMPKDLKNKAKAVAKESGFSSLQDVIRLFLTKFAKKQLTINLEENSVALSKKAIKRYNKMARDFETGKNIKEFSNWEDFMKDLRS